MLAVAFGTAVAIVVTVYFVAMTICWLFTKGK
jgi:hypothetical protein